MSIALPQIANLDLGLLRVFVAVVRSGGFSAARTELNVGQPTISNKIADLELRLGMRLCERGRGGFRLTVEGKHVYKAALDLFDSLETFRVEIGTLRGRFVGDLHIGVADATVTNSQLKLNEIIAAFKKKAPEVHLHLHTASAIELERGLVENHLHVAIGPLQRRRRELLYTPVLVEQQTLYCGRSHALFSRAPDGIDVIELGRVEFVARDYLANWQAPQGIQFKATATTGHMEATTQLILSGTHIGYLPEHYASPWVKTEQLRPILPSALSYGSTFSLVRRRSSATATLNEFVKEFRSVQARERAGRAG
jgi:DNA-binding transcriptional LysR family regulator